MIASRILPRRVHWVSTPFTVARPSRPLPMCRHVCGHMPDSPVLSGSDKEYLPDPNSASSLLSWNLLGRFRMFGNSSDLALHTSEEQTNHCYLDERFTRLHLSLIVLTQSSITRNPGK